MDPIRKNWTLVLVGLALVVSPVIAYTQSQSFAEDIAAKAEKRAVSKAANIIYDATIAACQRDNDRARELNIRAEALRELGVDANRVEVVDCEVEYKTPVVP